MKDSKCVVLVPSAKFVDTSLSPRFGEINSCLVPLGGMPLLSLNYLVHWRRAKAIYVLVEEGIEQVNHLVQHLGPNINTVDVTGTSSLSETIYRGLAKVEEDRLLDHRLVVNYGDTYLDDCDILQHLDAKNIAFTSSVMDSSRWAIINLSGNGLDIIEKKKGLQNIDLYAPFDALIGFFVFQSGQILKQYLTPKLSTQISDLNFYQSLSAMHADSMLFTINTDKWLDIGHADEYDAARTRIAPRFFNQVSIDHRRGTVTKHSDDISTLSREIEWYQNLPEEIKYVAPRFFYSQLLPRPSYTIEYVPYETMHELFVYGNHSPASWSNMLENMFLLLEEMHSFTKIVSPELYASAIQKMYVNKSITRLKKYLKNAAFDVDKSIEINGTQYLSISEILDIITSLPLISKESHFSVIHGDLCFSNILYNHSTNTIRLIDPRGEFGSISGVWGDKYYDYAKLSHSAVGHYDLIIADRFSVARDGNAIHLTLEATTTHELTGKFYLERLYASCIDVKWVRTIEGLLFLSMLPLHSDQPKRQLAMFANGVRLLSKYREPLNQSLTSSATFPLCPIG